MPEHLGLLQAKRLEPIGHPQVRRQAHPDRQSVDEQPHHARYSRQFRRSPGYNRPEHHVVLIRIPAEQQCPRTLHQHVNRKAAPASERVQLAGDYLRQHSRLPAILSRFTGVRPNRLSHRKRRRPFETSEEICPEHLRPRKILLMKPSNVAAVRRGWLVIRNRSTSKVRVTGLYIVQHSGDRPAIEQQVMMSPDEMMYLVACSYQCHPHQRSGRRRKPAMAVLVEESLDPFSLLTRLRTAPIKCSQRKPHGSLYDLNRFAESLPQETGPKHGVTLHYPLPRFFDEGGVRTASQRTAQLKDV